MSGPEKAVKLFSVEEANATLPLVRAIIQDLASLSGELVERRHRLEHLLAGREAEQGDPYAEELAQIQEEQERQTTQLQEYVNELRVLGVEPQPGPEKLTDVVHFPAKIEGQRVFLCWRLGEPEVSFWHDLETGFDGRQRIPTVATANSAGSSHDMEAG